MKIDINNPTVRLEVTVDFYAKFVEIDLLYKCAIQLLLSYIWYWYCVLVSLKYLMGYQKPWINATKIVSMIFGIGTFNWTIKFAKTS